MDAPSGASVMSEMGNRDRTARLYPACGWAVLLQPWWKYARRIPIRATVSWWTWGVTGLGLPRS